MGHEVSKVDWVSTKRLPRLRGLIRLCPNKDFREEGIACLRGIKKPEYLLNLIPQDHPDRIGIVQFITDPDNYFEW